MKEIVSVFGVLAGVALMMVPIHQRFNALDERLVSVEQRVTHVEAMVEVLLERSPPMGGRPVSAAGGDRGADGTSETLVQPAAVSPAGCER